MHLYTHINYKQEHECLRNFLNKIGTHSEVRKMIRMIMVYIDKNLEEWTTYYNIDSRWLLNDLATAKKDKKQNTNIHIFGIFEVNMWELLKDFEDDNKSCNYVSLVKFSWHLIVIF